MQLDDLKFASKEIDRLVAYLKLNPTVSDVLFTGGDPMIMRTELIRRYAEPLMDDDLEISTIRFGTKAPAYWPYKFTEGEEADDLLRLFEEICGLRPPPGHHGPLFPSCRAGHRRVP